MLELNEIDIKVIFINHEASWVFISLMNLRNSRDKQCLPQRLEKDCWIRLGLSNRRFEWLCQPVRYLWSYLPSLRESITRKAYITKVNQLNQNRKIETESSKFFAYFKALQKQWYR